MAKMTNAALCGALMLASPAIVARPMDDKVMRTEQMTTPPTAQDLKSRLVALGVDPKEADSRLAHLTAEERSQVARYLDTAPAGGDSTVTMSVGAAIIIALLLIIFL